MALWVSPLSIWLSFNQNSSILNFKHLSLSGFIFSPFHLTNFLWCNTLDLHFQILHTKYEYMVNCKRFTKKIKVNYQYYCSEDIMFDKKYLLTSICLSNSFKRLGYLSNRVKGLYRFVVKVIVPFVAPIDSINLFKSSL